MLRIEGKQTESPVEVKRHHLSEGEGLLFLCVLAASWAIAIAVGWLVWQIAPF